MSDPTYRQATSDDAETIAEIINTVVQEPNPVGFDGPTTVENVLTWLARQGGEGGIFLCLLDGEAAGFSALDFDTQSVAERSAWYIVKLRVAEIDHQRTDHKGHRRLVQAVNDAHNFELCDTGNHRRQYEFDAGRLDLSG